MPLDYPMREVKILGRAGSWFRVLPSVPHREENWAPQEGACPCPVFA